MTRLVTMLLGVAAAPPGRERVPTEPRRDKVLLVCLGGLMGLAGMLPFVVLRSFFMGLSGAASLAFGSVLFFGVLALRHPPRARSLGLAAIGSALTGGGIALILLWVFTTNLFVVGIVSQVVALLGAILALAGGAGVRVHGG